ncbi:MAG TPA: TerC/Alx family metal homeostasis membrane protein [Verrucomicrobiae bacterium]|nr:TerC/Alx family metal homeostasis membrane protein [Verrucomicrobiae bacterium]
MIEITPWLWLCFIVFVLFFLALDLGVFHRRAHVVRVPEAVAWSAFWVALAMLFAAALFFCRTRAEAAQFTTGYLIEVSLSLDNILVMAVIFAYFRVPLEWQHRLLFWGVLGALAMRGAMIAAGIALINRFEWILYVFGAFLVFAGIKMLVSKKQMQPEKNPVLRLAKRIFPISSNTDGWKLFTRLNGRLALTPLALVLLLIETTDLIFAVDSVPAVFSITRKAFIVFSSNVFAVLALRSMYFLLAGALGYFRCLKVGLSVVLVFFGVKMLLAPHGPASRWFQIQISTLASLIVVAAILSISIALSLAMAGPAKNDPRLKTVKTDLDAND